MELSDLIRRLKLAGLFFPIIMIIGVIGNGYISNGDWFDAFYMTSIAIATIDFREARDLDNSPFEKIFTFFLAFSWIDILLISCQTSLPYLSMAT